MAMNRQRRAERTRAMDRAKRDLYEVVTKPAHDKVEKILNHLLGAHDIRLKWVGDRRLKNGVTGARLMKIDFGGLGFTVHIDGYRTLQRYASRFWEIAE